MGALRWEHSVGDKRKAIRGVGGVGSGAPIGPGGWGRGGKTEREREKNQPGGNLPHCAKSPDNTINLHYFSYWKSI